MSLNSIRMQMASCLYRIFVLIGFGAVVFTAAGPAVADPPPADQGPDPYPDIRYYDKLDAASFAQPGGAWFIAPTGQNCGIWGLGSFGCAGDIPGAPPGTSHIGCTR